MRREAWIPKTGGARHDFHDAETYSLALALGLGRCEGRAVGGCWPTCG